MSVQFGKCNFDGKPVDHHDLEGVRPLLSPYGPDGEGLFRKASVGILYRAFHTTEESRSEVQPHVCASGSVIAWDGRLDNRSELIRELNSGLLAKSADVLIVAEAYCRWGTRCFAKLAGDWALSICDPDTRTVLLAKDPIGTRHLYYSFERAQVVWSSLLDPLVLGKSRSVRLDEEYLAGWLSLFPASHLTPYVGVHSVAPSSFVSISNGTSRVSQYWTFDPHLEVKYRKDAEYEEHFRGVFATAVRRRLRSDKPILAELSGGMDSSSIVCMADTLIRGGEAGNTRIDTISYYDDSEPNWNELPYVRQVEARLGRVGRHIDVSSQYPLGFDFQNQDLRITPGTATQPSKAWKEFAGCMSAQGNRVVLSGVGGDEVTGGVPTAMPELCDLLAGVKLLTLARQLKFWALSKRKPWLHLLFDAAQRFLVASPAGASNSQQSGLYWLSPDFANRNRKALSGYACRLRVFGSRPSFQENLGALDGLRRQLSCSSLHCDPPLETRYPYLDRDLLEFMYAIPREQVIRPGQRRSLMRRALVGIVPKEVLNRRRKAFIARVPLAAISSQWTGLCEIVNHMISESIGIVDARRLQEILQKGRRGEPVSMVPLMRTLGIELWLRNLATRGKLQHQSEGVATMLSTQSIDSFELLI